ncbi:MAG: hypothetical protein Q9204_000060 [Flavoplaca sp. TL-2023a]
MALTEDEIDQMRTAVENWLFTDPVPGGLAFAKNKTIAKAYANSQLEPDFHTFFQRLPNGKFAEEAPYGFVRWVYEASKAKVKTENGMKRGSTEPPASLSLTHISNAEPSRQVGSEAYRFEWLRVVAFHSESQPSSGMRVSLDAIMANPPSGDILSARVAVRFVSHDTLMSCIKYRLLLTASSLALIAREDPSLADTGRRRRLIDCDFLLREAIRYMLEVRGRPIEFWVTDDTNEDIVEDLLTRPVPPSDAPPTSDVQLAPTALSALTTAPTRRDKPATQAASGVPLQPPLPLKLKGPVPPSGPDAPPASDLPTALSALTTAPTRRDKPATQAASGVPLQPPLLLKLKVRKEYLANLGSGEEDPAVTGKDEDEIPRKRLRRATRSTKPRIPLSSSPESSNSEGSDGYQPTPPKSTSDSLEHDSDVEIIDKPVNNPMFDPEGKEMEELAGEGNRDLGEEDDEEVLYHLNEKLSSHSMLSRCEFLDFWALAAAFIKVDPNQLSSEPCVRLPEIEFPLYQYQWNGVYKCFTMSMEDTNGAIMADEMGMGKTLQMIALIKLTRDFILNCRDVDREWDSPPREASARRHCHRDGSGTCSANKDMWFVCVCIPGNPHHGWRPTDGHFEIISPPMMLGSWIREWAKFYKPTNSDDKLEFVVGHTSLGKGTTTFGQKVKLADGSIRRLDELLTGPAPTLPLPPHGDENCHYREVNGRWILESVPKGPHRKGSPRYDSSRLVVLTSYQSWSTQVQNAASQHTYWYSNTPKGHKMTSESFRTITPGMVIVDEAHTCSKSGVGHYGTVDEMDKMTSYTIKKIFLSGTPIRKGPGDLIAMIEALESPVWKEEGHRLNGLISQNLEYFNEKFKEVKTVRDLGLQAVIDGIARLIPLVAIRRTNESKWFDLPLRPPIKSVKQDREMGFPPKYLPALNNLRDHIAGQLNNTLTLGGEISKTELRSMSRLYRLASNTPFLAQFWSQDNNVKHRFLSEDMKKWLDEDGTLSAACPLAKHAADIRANSPKLDFIGTILDSMTNPNTAKLLIVTDFVASAWSCFDYVTHHRSKQSALLYHPGLTRKTREAMLEGFQRVKKLDDVSGIKLAHPEWDKRVWIGTIKSMGLGLTLTAADKVIVLEPNTMPTDEAQVIARAIRIGQEKVVFVNRLVCPAVGIEKVILNTNSLRDFLVTRAFVG